MKRAVLALVLAAAIMSSGCIGSFSLTQKLYSWNQDATGNKFVDTGIMWVLGFILPVYGATMLIDVAILNLIEFWTGSNPMAFSGPESQEKLVTSNGKTFKVIMGNNTLSIDQLDGQDADKGITIRFDNTTKSYYMDGQKNVSVKLGTIENDNLHLYLPDGRIVTRKLHEPASSVASSK